MSSSNQILQQFNQALQSGNLHSLTSLFAKDLKTNLDSGVIAENAGPANAIERAKEFSGDPSVKVLETISSGDKLIIRFQYEVDGSAVEGAAPGSSATVHVICIATVKDGKITEAKIEQDTGDLLLQLGLGIADA